MINVIVVIVLYIVTYVMLDKRTIQRDDNKKEVADMLLQDCYVQCEKNIEFLTPEMVKDNIVPKVNLDEMLNKNPIYKNLTELPFSSEEVILELAKDGQIIATKLKLFFEIKEQYRQYINMVIICYDRPEKTKEFLNILMEKIKETHDTNVYYCLACFPVVKFKVVKTIIQGGRYHD